MIVNRKLPVGVIGLGRMGTIYAGHLARHARSQIVCVSDVIKERAETLAAELGVDAWSTDYRDVLENKAVEVSRNALYGYDIRTEILGTEGSLNIGYYQQTPLLVMTTKGISHDMVPYIIERFGHAYLDQTEDFVERVLNDKEPAVGAYDACAALVIGLAARQSYFEARPVELVEYS
jgi:predicted dehydrogenase